MKKCLLAFCFFTAACNDGSQNFLPNSIGKIDELLVLMDENNWNEEIGETFRKNFTAPFLVLPQTEPVFSIQHKTTKEFNHLLQKYRNIVIVASLDEQNDVADLMRKTLGEENVNKVKQGSSTFYIVRRDVWVKPQILLLVFASTKNDLLQQLNQNSEMLIDEIHDLENKVIEEKLFVSGKNETVNKIINTKFKINFPFPIDYQVAKESENFAWLRKETADLSSNIMIYVQQYSDSTDWKQSWKLRNVIGRKFISGSMDAAYMITDTMIQIIQKPLSVNGNEILETRGLWRMENEFMGGPFINYVYDDKKNKRIIMLDGFVYAPKLKKRQYIRQLEVLFSKFLLAKEN